MPESIRTAPRLIHLLAFDAVASLGSMRQAAEALNLTQPAITYGIHALERRLGIVLLTRGRGSFLTPAGSIFARRVTRVIAQLRNALALVTGHQPADEPITRLLRQLTDLHLRVLVAIEEQHSFRRAAQKLGVAEPSLHRPAREIEQVLGVPLYRRTQDGSRLSPEGAEFARRMLLVLAEIRAAIEDAGAAGQGDVAIGVLPLAPKDRLAAATQALLQFHPHSRISVLEASYDELVRDLRRGAIDLLFGALRAPPPFDDLAERRMFEDPYVLVARRGHSLAGKPALAPADVAPFGWVFPTPSLPRRAVLDMILANWGIEPDLQLQTNSVGLITASILASDRLGLWPRSIIAAEPHFGGLAVLDIAPPQPARVVGLTHRSDWLPTFVQSAFLAKFLEGVSGD
eukprot:gene10980-11061_t